MRIVPTTGPVDYASVYKLMQALAERPPLGTCVYAIAQKGMSLPAPYVAVVRPLALPTDAAHCRQWEELLVDLKAFGEGVNTYAMVLDAIDEAMACQCTQPQCVMTPSSLGTLREVPLWYAAVGRGYGEHAKGAVALFRGSELQSAQ